MISYNNSAPTAVNNVGQFGATEGSIGAYKSAAEYAADAKYWALLSQTKYSSVDEILAEVERLYAQGYLLESDIKQLKEDFEAQNQTLLGLIQSTGSAIDNTNAATELSKEATQQVLEQLDIISNMTVQTTLLPPGSLATGSYDNTTGVFSFGIPEGKPGRDGTDGQISGIGETPVGTPVSDDYGFFVDKDTGGLYRTSMVDIANLVPSVRSVSLNGGVAQTGEVSLQVVSSFNSRTGVVSPQAGDYTVEQVTGAAKSGDNSDITALSGLITPLSLLQGGTGSSTAEGSRSNLGLGDVSVEDIVPISKGGTGASSPDTARLTLIAAKSGANSDITSMANKVTFSQPIRIPNAVESDEAVSLGQISNVISQELGLPTGFNLIGDLPSIEQLQTLEGASVGDKVFVRSYVEGANMGGGVFVAIDNSETADGVVVFSGVSVKWKRLLFSGEASVFDAGYTGSGDIAVYINKVNSSGYDCIVPTSGSVLSEIVIDISKGALIGYNKCKLQEGAGATGQYFLKIINSNTDYVLRDSISSTAKISGVSFVGLGARKVVIGGTDSGEVSEVRIENCGFISTAGIEFLDNSYRILFDKCAISRSFTDTIVFKSRANSGEVVKFSHCWCVDNGGPFTFENGQFIFDTCSLPAGKKSGYFDPTIKMSDNATVVFSNGNIEYQPDQSFVSFLVNGSSRLSIKDSTILVPVGFSSVPIVNNGDGFVSLTNCSLPLYGNNTLATGFPTRQLVGGDSKKIVSNGCYPRAGFVLSRWDLGSIVSPYINSLSNGSGQFLNTSNWTPTQTGSGVVSVSQTNDVPSSSPMFNTSFSFGVPDINSSVNFTQVVSECHPGRYFQFGFWAKNTTTTLASIRFLDSAGNAVAESLGYYIPNSDSFSFYAVIDSVPPGSSKAEINFNIGGKIGGCVLHNIIYGLI